jgi:uncharacterized protein
MSIVTVARRLGVLMAVLYGMAAGMPAALAAEKSMAEHKLVIQVSTDDEKTQALALNNAVNLQKEYGPENIDIEIVAYGPGLSIMTDPNQLKDRVASLAKQDIHFSACGNTMSSIKAKTGKEPKLVDGVKIVPAGVKRIIELQEQGYSYIRP